MVLVEAKVIYSTHLELSKPIETPHGQRVMVSVAEPTGEGEVKRGRDRQQYHEKQIQCISQP